MLPHIRSFVGKLVVSHYWDLAEISDLVTRTDLRKSKKVV